MWSLRPEGSYCPAFEMRRCPSCTLLLQHTRHPSLLHGAINGGVAGSHNRRPRRGGTMARVRAVVRATAIAAPEPFGESFQLRSPLGLKFPVSQQSMLSLSPA